jgi:hypothetical protein
MECIVALVQKEKILYYRVSIYNYLQNNFVKHGLRLVVLAESAERGNPDGIHFELIRMKIRSVQLLQQLEKLKPSAVIIFLSLKHSVIWPVLLYALVRGCKVLNWGHAIDLSMPGHFVKNWMYYLVKSCQQESYCTQKGKSSLCRNDTCTGCMSQTTR